MTRFYVTKTPFFFRQRSFSHVVRIRNNDRILATATESAAILIAKALCLSMDITAYTPSTFEVLEQ